jgi:hypothetical protein
MTENELLAEADRLRSLSRADLREILSTYWMQGQRQLVGQLLEMLGLPVSWLGAPAHSPARAELEHLQRVYDLPTTSHNERRSNAE